MRAERDWIDLSKELKLQYDEIQISSDFRPVLEHVRKTIGSGNYWQVSEDELFDLYSIVRTSGSKCVVETGVGPGTSSYSILSALKSNGGMLHSIDLGQKYGEDEEKPVGFVVPETDRGQWDLNYGKSRDLLPGIVAKHNPIDIFFHDSEHTYENVTFELETVYPYLKNGSFIVVDNYDWTEAPADFANKRKLKLTKTHDDMCIISL